MLSQELVLHAVQTCINPQFSVPLIREHGRSKEFLNKKAFSNKNFLDFLKDTFHALLKCSLTRDVPNVS